MFQNRLELAVAAVFTGIISIFRGRDYYAKYIRMYSVDLAKIPSFSIVLKNSKGRVVEVGCGIGYISKYFDSDNYVGLDVSQDAIRTAKRLTGHSFLVASAENLPFRQGSFDTAISYDVIEHVYRTGSMVSEIRRASSNALISCIDFASWYRFFSFDSTHIKMYVPSELDDILGEFYKVTIIKTSGIFSAGRLKKFLEKYGKNQIVAICKEK